ncbi:MAG TPA: VWA domain-containing protein [Pirellulaceae bacterium]|nr:VWA domain-containing protein [Pirellulaceae bacterium]
MSQHNGDHQSSEPAAEALTALVLNQLHGEERTAAEAQLAAGGEAAQREVHEIQALSAALTAARSSQPLPQRSAELRQTIDNRLGQVELPPKRQLPWSVVAGVSAVALASVLYILMLPAAQSAREGSRRVAALNRVRQAEVEAAAERQLATDSSAPVDINQWVTRDPASAPQPDATTLQSSVGSRRTKDGYLIAPPKTTNELHTQAPGNGQTVQLPPLAFADKPASVDDYGKFPSVGGVAIDHDAIKFHATKRSDAGVVEAELARHIGDDATLKPADPKAAKSLTMMVTPRIIVQESEEAKLGIDLPDGTHRVQVWLDNGQSVYVTGTELAELVKRTKERLLRQAEGRGTEQYERIIENAFLSPRQQPLSTFSIDVDTASYANVRRFLTGGSLPPVNAVRIEELVNYFKYDYPQPKAGEPFSVNMEVAECPWQTGHLLLRVGLKGKEVAKQERPPSNLVFLLDVSGSMSDENKLPLLKSAMKLLVGELGENDRVSIVTYAGEAGLRLPPTRGHEQSKINAAIDSLSAGGSTNGSAGINLAYEQAAAYFAKGGTNRVILCTDGDLNVGVTSDDALVELIKQKAAGGTFLTVLGFGEGNLKDAKLEKLADNGNGLYAYIDGLREARRVLVEQLTGSTITIAKDVKIQIEFNPQEVAAYRLLGYENRVLAAEDFNNDEKDAGEIGAGHTVTALYELVPAGGAEEPAPAAREQLKYQEPGARRQAPVTDHRSPTTDHRLTEAAKSGELLTLKLRYKEPEGTESRLLEHPLKDRGGTFHAASRDMQFAASVASFGMILRGSQHRGSGNLPAVLEIASTSLGDDTGGYRAEFVDLVRKAQSLGAR